MVKYPVFLSCSTPFLKRQADFLEEIEQDFKARGLDPRTLGRSDYDMDAPLEGIRRLMIGCCGFITLAFRRTLIKSGTERPHSDIGLDPVSRSGQWITSPYCHIEAAMAFQLGLPLLIWREEGVFADGVLDRGAVGISMPEFSLENGPPDLKDNKWRQQLDIWDGRVRSVYMNRGSAPKVWS